jgi:hypothetical protein
MGEAGIRINGASSASYSGTVCRCPQRIGHVATGPVQSGRLATFLDHQVAGDDNSFAALTTATRLLGRVL